MTKADKKLKNIENIVRYMYNKVNEDGGSYVVDMSFDINDLAVELEFDITFDNSEIKSLNKLGFKLSKDNKRAIKIFRNTTVNVEKIDFSEYTLRFNKIKSKKFEDDITNDLSDMKSTSRFFKVLYKSIKQ